MVENVCEDDGRANLLVENSPSGSACLLAVCIVLAPTYTNAHFTIVEPFGDVFSSTRITLRADVPKFLEFLAYPKNLPEDEF